MVEDFLAVEYQKDCDERRAIIDQLVEEREHDTLWKSLNSVGARNS
jgi:hypothetical protein